MLSALKVRAAILILQDIVTSDLDNKLESK